MKTPAEIIKYRNKTIEVINWAVEQGYIEKQIAEDSIIPSIYDIELDMYPKKMVKDENGWEHPESEFIYGLDIDDWE